jgi:hypothetical protein
MGYRRPVVRGCAIWDIPTRVLCGPCSRNMTPEEAVARIGFGVAAPQHVEVAARRHPTCWGVDARDWIRATASERALCVRSCTRNLADGVVIMDEQQIARAVGASAIAFGAFAVLTPRALARAFGIRNIDREVIYLLRFAGVADAALGINLVSAEEPESRRRLLLLAAVVDGLNCVLALPAGLSRRTVAMLLASNGIVAATAAVPILRGRP